MTKINTTFIYSPARQGYDLSSWKTISGAPAIASGRLNVKAGGSGETAHYADILKGDISFSVVPIAQAATCAASFGLSSLGATPSKLMFVMTNTLNCVTSDGITTTTSPALVFDPAWVGVDTKFRVLWEAGKAKFYINNTMVYQISDSSVPYGPLALDLIDASSVGNITVGDIVVRGSQSLVVNPKVS